MDNAEKDAWLAVGRLHRNQAERDKTSWGCECEGCTYLRQLSSAAAQMGRLGGLAGRGKKKQESGRKGGKATGPSKRRDTWKANFAKKPKTQE